MKEQTKNALSMINNILLIIATLVSGGLCGLCVDLVLFPLDTIKTKLGGFSHPFRGILSLTAGSIPSAAVYWVCYDQMKEFINQRFPHNNQYITYSISATVGECFSSLIRVPFEAVKQMTQAGLYKSSTLAAKAVFKQEGFFGFYYALYPLLCRDIPFDIIEFVLYEKLKKMNENRKHQFYYHMWTGSVAGAIGAFLTTPIDVIKTRCMVQPRKYRNDSVKSIVKKFIKKEGYMVLMSGWIPRTLWIGLGGAIYFGSYEEFKVILNKL